MSKIKHIEIIKLKYVKTLVVVVAFCLGAEVVVDAPLVVEEVGLWPGAEAEVPVALGAPVAAGAHGVLVDPFF